MSGLRAFHLRRQLNVLHRSLLTRSYSAATTSSSDTTESSKPDWTNLKLPSQDEQISFLEDMDDLRLNQTLEALAAVTRELNAMQNVAFPQAIPEIPRYRQASKLQTALANGLERAETLRLHVQDLKAEPYKWKKQRAEGEWHEKIARMSRGEKQEEYKRLNLEEQALAARLTSLSENMMGLANKIKQQEESPRIPDYRAVHSASTASKPDTSGWGVSPIKRSSETKVPISDEFKNYKPFQTTSGRDQQESTSSPKWAGDGGHSVSGPSKPVIPSPKSSKEGMAVWKPPFQGEDKKKLGEDERALRSMSRDRRGFESNGTEGLLKPKRGGRKRPPARKPTIRLNTLNEDMDIMALRANPGARADAKPEVKSEIKPEAQRNKVDVHALTDDWRL